MRETAQDASSVSKGDEPRDKSENNDDLTGSTSKNLAASRAMEVNFLSVYVPKKWALCKHILLVGIFILCGRIFSQRGHKVEVRNTGEQIECDTSGSSLIDFLVFS